MANDAVPRRTILHEFAKWTAMRAVRGNSLASTDGIKLAFEKGGVRELIDRLIEASPQFDSSDAFDKRHADICTQIRKNVRDPKITFGWAAKVLNIYLKTRVYVGKDGLEHLGDYLHPPLDRFLWKELRDKPDIRRILDEHGNPFESIGGIRTKSKYLSIVKVLRKAHETVVREGTFFELERYWKNE